jgi:hypothetical protein
MVLGQGESQSFQQTFLCGTIGLNTKIMVIKRVYLVLDLSVGASPTRQRFLRLSDDSVVATTPFVDWSGMLGFLFYL